MASAERSVPGAVLGAAAITLLAFRDGGFDPSTWRAATVALLAAAALAIVLRRLPRRAGSSSRSCSGSPRSPAGRRSLRSGRRIRARLLLEAQRTLVYVAAVVAAVAVGGRLLAGTLAGIGVVCAYAVGQRLLEGPPDPPDPFEGTLLQEPLGYANGLGGLAAIGVAAASRPRASAPPAARSLRRSGGLFLVTLVLTESRGGWVAALAGAAVALSLAWGRRRLAVDARGLAGSCSRWRWRCPRARSSTRRLREAATVRGTGTSPGRRPRTFPVAGRGAGTFELAWLEQQPIPVSVVDAHSLYLETLAELGLVGLGLLVLALAPPLAGRLPGRERGCGRRLRRLPLPRRRRLGLGAAGGHRRGALLRRCAARRHERARSGPGTHLHG